ncbi:uncharacterized protein LOC128961135 [Oppia nitens]|uniref:uncharacterized protein LOC128961135 n=1 Tax=Oppia nitens TaxID=1686743 RepID=UPI0023DCE1CF|nr:uncharacterized protein LOC128961135 [Oppia nitens]
MIITNMLTLFIFFVSIVKYGQTIYCWNCNSYKDKGCDNVPRGSHISALSDEIRKYYVDCNTLTTGTTGSIATVTETKGSTRITDTIDSNSTVSSTKLNNSTDFVDNSANSTDTINSTINTNPTTNPTLSTSPTETTVITHTANSDTNKKKTYILCRKQVQQIDDNKRTIRSCGYLTEGNDCYQTGKSYVCECKTDGCNTSSPIVVTNSILLPLMTIVLSLLSMSENFLIFY